MKSIHILPLLLILPLILIMAAPASTGTSPTMQPANSPSGGLQFVGTVLPNGDVAILYYTAPVGTTIIHRDTVVPLDQISLEIYSPDSGTLSVLGEQFQKFVSENITIPSGNKSYTTQISVPYNPDKFNATIQTQTRSPRPENITGMRSGLVLCWNWIVVLSRVSVTYCWVDV